MMTETESANLQSIRHYLDALQSGASGDALARFFTPDALQVEWPNRLHPQARRSDLPALLQRTASAPLLLVRQAYAVDGAIARGAQVAVEAVWSATLAAPVGSLAAGAEMRAHVAMFFEMREGRICAQRNYDCFDAW